MVEVKANQLKDAVEGMHNCVARLVQSVPIREPFERKTAGKAWSTFSLSRGIPRPRKPMPGHPR
jgi:hypothetical protein